MALEVKEHHHDARSLIPDDKAARPPCGRGNNVAMPNSLVVRRHAPLFEQRSNKGLNNCGIFNPLALIGGDSSNLCSCNAAARKGEKHATDHEQ